MASVVQHNLQRTNLEAILILSQFSIDHMDLIIITKSRPDTRPDTINTRPRRRPSVQLETDRPGIEARILQAMNIIANQ